MATVDVPRLSSEFGSGRGGWGPQGNIVRENIPLTRPAVEATITVGAEAGDARAITVQLKDVNGNVLTERETVGAFVFLDAAGADIAVTGGSTGIAIGADGKILATVVSKKVFVLRTDATGKVTLTWTDTGTEAAYLGIQLPNGRTVISSALTNA